MIAPAERAAPGHTVAPATPLPVTAVPAKTTSEPAECDTAGNAALHRPAIASSVQDDGYLAPNAVDGNPDTRWSSARSDPQWIQVDLGSSQRICQVVLLWESASATAYQIQTSSDANTWASVYQTTTSIGGTETVTVTGTGRYLRVYGTTRATGWGYSLRELTVHIEDPSTTSPTPSKP